MKLRFALSTASYGRRFHRIDEVLDDAADAGFEGIEITQACNMLGVESHRDLERMARRRGLTVIGYSGGTLASRMEFCGRRFKGYLSMDSVDEDSWWLAFTSGWKPGGPWERGGEKR